MRKAVLLAAVAAAAPAHAAPEPVGAVCGLISVSDPDLPGHQTGIDDTHAGADAAVVTGPDSVAVVAAAGAVTYPAAAGEAVWLCTSVNIVGYGTLYRDAPNDTWSTSPFVECDRVA